MNVREITESNEQKLLSSYAQLSQNSKGRLREENQCELRTCFQRDRDRILHSKSFRRLKQKTQVYISPIGDHYRTRLTHTLEVSQISRTIARALRLNEDLVEAISLGHDLGHSPFGHDGEMVLNKICPHGFAHNKQSLRVVDIVEKSGRGLNLTSEVRDGILKHSGGLGGLPEEIPSTLEAKIVRITDRIAYINHDIDDSIRAGVLSNEDLPKECIKVLGETHSQRITTMCNAIITESFDKPDIYMNDEVLEAMNELRSFMTKNVYKNFETAKKQSLKVEYIITSLYEYFLNSYMDMPSELIDLIPKYDVPMVVCDYISGMTDTYAIEMFNNIFVPKPWQ